MPCAELWNTKDTRDAVPGSWILFTHSCMGGASLPQGHTAHDGNIAKGLLEEREEGIKRHFRPVSSRRHEFGAAQKLIDSNGCSCREYPITHRTLARFPWEPWHTPNAVATLKSPDEVAYRKLKRTSRMNLKVWCWCVNRGENDSWDLISWNRVQLVHPVTHTFGVCHIILSHSQLIIYAKSTTQGH